MSDRSFHTITIGCKLNQFDTAAIDGELLRRGYRQRSDPARADVVVINTCSVTGRAEADARRLIRSVRRANPRCTLLVTGCYADYDAPALRSIDGVDRVFGNEAKERLGRILDDLGLGAESAGGEPARSDAVVDLAADSGEHSCEASLALPRSVHFAGQNRAFLKIQEGCDLRCSYCVIPRVRGASRSVRPEAVVAAARSLSASGYREVVLTGINCGSYGRDLDPPTDLADLLRQLLDRCGPGRIRLNSLEPRTVTDGILELMAEEPRLAPHLQIPLQSGSNPVLRAMRRNYRVEEYLERLRRAREAVPHAGLGADVIVGFPGETEEQFQETYDFIAGSPLNYLHVFSWSERRGTAASELPGRVAPVGIRDRSARLRDLAGRLSLRFRREFIGRRLDAIVLGPRKSDGAGRALTGNYIEVALAPGSSAKPGELVRVRIDDATPRESRATVDGVPDWT